MNRTPTRPFAPRLLLPLLALATSACSMWPLRQDPPAPAADDAQALFRRLSALCGQAYLGRVVADIPENAADPYSGRALVMHVRECAKHEIRIPFQVGSDRSRTWVFVQHGHGLQLRHDHRRADGSEDPLSRYGGSAERIEVAGGRIEAEFPADAASRSLFRRLGRPDSAQNVWTVSLDGQRFVYKLARPGRLFRVEFDLSRPLAAPPPPPWGASDPPPAPAKPKPRRAPKTKKPR